MSPSHVTHFVNPFLVGVVRPMCGGGGTRNGWPVWKSMTRTTNPANVTCQKCLDRIAKMDPAKLAKAQEVRS